MKLNLVNDIDLLLNKGDAMIDIKDGKKQLVICCPQCGQISASAGNHIYNEETQSYTPSIVHNKELGGCGWHGWLTNGEFKSC